MLDNDTPWITEDLKSPEEFKEKLIAAVRLKEGRETYKWETEDELAAQALSFIMDEPVVWPENIEEEMTNQTSSSFKLGRDLAEGKIQYDDLDPKEVAEAFIEVSKVVLEHDHRLGWYTTCKRCASMFNQSYEDYCALDEAKKEIDFLKGEIEYYKDIALQAVGL